MRTFSRDNLPEWALSTKVEKLAEDQGRHLELGVLVHGGQVENFGRPTDAFSQTLQLGIMQLLRGLTQAGVPGALLLISKPMNETSALVGGGAQSEPKEESEETCECLFCKARKRTHELLSQKYPGDKMQFVPMVERDKAFNGCAAQAMAEVVAEYSKNPGMVAAMCEKTTSKLH